LRDPWLTRFARCVTDDVHSFRVQVAVTRFSRVRRLQIFNFVESKDCIMVRRRRAAQHNGGNMKTLFAAVLLAVTFAGFGAANAAGGCGLGYHRGPYGGCRPNGGVVVVAPRVVRPAVVVVPRARVCPYGSVWRYGRCRAF
jgi:hypothetical protein